jgi:hypothetical protein
LRAVVAPRASRSCNVAVAKVDCSRRIADPLQKVRKGRFPARSRVLNRSTLGCGIRTRGASRGYVLARDLAGPAPTIDESWTGGAVLDLLAVHPVIPSFAVVEDESRRQAPRAGAALSPVLPAGLVRRPYRGPIAPLLTREAMIVDGATPIEGGEGADRRSPSPGVLQRLRDRRARELSRHRHHDCAAGEVDLAHRRAIELEEAHRKAAGASEANPASLTA